MGSARYGAAATNAAPDPPADQLDPEVVGRVRELWRPIGYATDGDPAFLVDFAKRLAWADWESVYLIVAPPGGGDPWDEPVVVVRPDGKFASWSRRALSAEGVAVPEAAIEGRCVEVGPKGGGVERRRR